MSFDSPACAEDSGLCMQDADSSPDVATAPDAAALDPCEIDRHSADCLDSHLLMVRSFGAVAGGDFKGEAQNRGVDLTTDDAGNVYVVGHFSGTTRFGATELTSQGLMDGFVAKLDPNLEPIWARATLQSEGLDSAHYVAVDSRHEVWVFSCAPLEDPYTMFFGTHKVRLDKYAADGTLLLTVPFVMRGSLWTKEGQMLVVDSQDNVYLALDFDASVTIAGKTVTTGDPSINIDSLIAKFSSDGTLLWMENYGGTFLTIADNLELVRRGAEERLLLAGAFSGDLGRKVPPRSGSPTASNGFVVELDLNGQTLALTTDGDDKPRERFDAITGTALTDDGRLLVAAISLLTFPTPSTSNGWLGVYDAEGVALGEKSVFGGESEDGPLDMMILADGRVAIAGVLSGLRSLSDSSSYQPPDPEYPDLLLAVYRDTGDRLELAYSGAYGGPGHDRVTGLAQAPSGEVYVTGMVDGLVQIGDFKVGLPDARSILVMKLSP